MDYLTVNMFLVQKIIKIKQGQEVYYMLLPDQGKNLENQSPKRDRKARK
jgi:hypothetical protein